MIQIRTISIMQMGSKHTVFMKVIYIRQHCLIKPVDYSAKFQMLSYSDVDLHILHPCYRRDCKSNVTGYGNTVRITCRPMVGIMAAHYTVEHHLRKRKAETDSLNKTDLTKTYQFKIENIKHRF